MKLDFNSFVRLFFSAWCQGDLGIAKTCQKTTSYVVGGKSNVGAPGAFGGTGV